MELVQVLEGEHAGQVAKSFTSIEEMMMLQYEGSIADGDLCAMDASMAPFSPNKDYVYLSSSGLPVSSLGPGSLVGQVVLGDGTIVDYDAETITTPDGEVKGFWVLLIAFFVLHPYVALAVTLVLALTLTYVIWRLTLRPQSDVRCEGDICFVTAPDGSTCTYDVNTGEILHCTEPDTTWEDAVVYAAIAAVLIVGLVMLRPGKSD